MKQARHGISKYHAHIGSGQCDWRPWCSGYGGAVMARSECNMDLSLTVFIRKEFAIAQGLLVLMGIIVSGMVATGLPHFDQFMIVTSVAIVMSSIFIFLAGLWCRNWDVAIVMVLLMLAGSTILSTSSEGYQLIDWLYGLGGDAQSLLLFTLLISLGFMSSVLSIAGLIAIVSRSLSSRAVA